MNAKVNGELETTGLRDHETTQQARAPRKFRYLQVSKVEGLIHEQGKMATEEFLLALDQHIANCVRRACAVHNGGRKRLDAHVAGHVGIR